MATQSPTVRRRRLAAELRRLRGERNLTVDAVAESLGWHAAKLSRIETAGRSAPPADVRALLALYEVDAGEADALLVLARQARQRGWWEAYKDVLPSHYSTYVGLEAEAESICSYEALIVPGLLQTERYARAMIRDTMPHITEEEVDNRVAVRMQRTQLLASAQLHHWAILDEAAIRRQVGGRETMFEQVRRIVELSALPNVTVQVIPYDVGAYPGMPGSFAIVRFPQDIDRDVIYVESMAGDLFLERAADVKRYTITFEHLRAIALSPTDSVRLITSTALVPGSE